MPRALTRLVALAAVLLALATVGAWAYRAINPRPADPDQLSPEVATQTVGGILFEVEHRPGDFVAATADDSAAFTRGPDLLDYEDGVLTVNTIGFPGPKPGDVVRWNLDGPLLINGVPQAPHPLQPRPIAVPGTVLPWQVRLTPGSPTPRDTLSVAWSRVGRVLVAANGDGVVRVWDVDTPVVRATLVPDPPTDGDRGAWGLRAAVSPDGKTVAAVNVRGAAVTLWDVATGAKLATLSGLKGTTAAVEFAGDHQLVEARGDTLDLRDLTGDRARVVGLGAAHAEFQPPFALSGDGRTLARIDGGAVVVEHLPPTTPPPAGVTVGKVSPAAVIALSADGRTLAVFDGTARLALYDAATGAVAQRLRWRAGRREAVAVGAMAFSPDGKTLAAGESGSVRLYDVASGRERGWVKTPMIRALAYSADGRTLAAGLRSAPGVVVWETAALVAAEQ